MQTDKMLSQTSKMPCPSISLDAEWCNTGSKLAKKKGTVCFDCYAKKGFYRMPNVKKAMERRWNFFYSKEFIPEMVKKLIPYNLFRWFDAGDMQSVNMGLDILEIAEKTPWCRHWIPSKEYLWWREILVKKELPFNVTLRISTPKHDNKPIKGFSHTSTTYSSKSSEAFVGFNCPAHIHKKDYGKYECGNCNACWNKEISNIAYPIK